MAKKIPKKKKTKKISVRKKIHKKMDNVMDKTEKIGRKLSTKGKASAARLTKKTKAIEKKVDTYVQKNPKKSLSIAAGLGLVAGALAALLFGRKR